jgi:putative endonuclease
LAPSCGGPNPSSPTLHRIFMKYLVYILRSLKDDKLYIGQTNDIEDRIKRHNNGQVNATQNRRPLEVIHVEKFSNRAEAMRREKYLKSLKNLKYIKENIINKKR